MKRKCNLIIKANDGRRAIYVDKENQGQIIAYLNRDKRHRKKFKFISEIILGGHINTEVYDKEEINEKCKDVAAMKFFKGQENDRIYCKEVNTQNGMFVVIAAHLHEKKKTQKLTPQLINIIEKIGGYDYEI